MVLARLVAGEGGPLGVAAEPGAEQVVGQPVGVAATTSAQVRRRSRNTSASASGSRGGDARRAPCVTSAWRPASGFLRHGGERYGAASRRTRIRTAGTSTDALACAGMDERRDRVRGVHAAGLEDGAGVASTGRRRSGPKAVEIAQLAEQLGYDSIWVYDHFHNVPRPAHEAVFECWTTMAAISQLTSRDPPRADGRLQQLSQPGPAGEDHLDGRRRLRRAPRLGHRRRVVRERVPRLRLRVPEAEGPHRHAARDGRDRHEHVDPAGDDVQGRALRAVAGELRPEAAAGPAPAGLDRRRWRAAHAARRRPPRRLLELRRQPRASGRTSATCCGPTAPTSAATRTRSA